MSGDVCLEKENVVANDMTSATTCHVLIKKMHTPRGLQVTSAGFNSHHLHILCFDFALFVFVG